MSHPKQTLTVGDTRRSANDKFRTGELMLLDALIDEVASLKDLKAIRLDQQGCQRETRAG